MLLISSTKSSSSKATMSFHKHCVSYFLIAAHLILCPCYSLTSNLNNEMLCEKYNETMCNSNGEGCNGTEECKPGESEKGNLCYVLWQNTSKSLTIKLKGCWVGSHDACSSKNRCVETRREPNVQLLFCCCEGSMCNRNMVIPSSIFVPTSAAKTSTAAPIHMASSTRQVRTIMLVTVLPLIVLTVIVTIGFLVYRRRKMALFNELPTNDPSPLPPPSPLLGLRPIQLLEVKAQGRFGAVWKALINNEPIAVKIFPPQDKNSWIVEQEIYMLPRMKHDNILHFIGVEKRGDHLQTEYWLISSYHDKGSLCDFLKANLVTWADVLRISDSIAKGLMHLHEEFPAVRGEKYKPAVAHRDFKSKNVLIRNDMTACIADFGLALMFSQEKPTGQAHGQVGTRRYMAPEVLEGAINFNRDAFIRIDMYACGLVLWELLSRCSAVEGPVDQYMLPFEDTVGQHPTLEDMQEVVSQKKIRPKFKDIWKKHAGINVLCGTIEECWDQDADARLSACCIQERLSSIYKTQPPYPETQISMLKAAPKHFKFDHVLLEITCSTATSNVCPDAASLSRSQLVLLPKESSI